MSNCYAFTYLLLYLQQHLSNGVVKASLFITTFITVESVFHFCQVVCAYTEGDVSNFIMNGCNNYS